MDQSIDTLKLVFDVGVASIASYGPDNAIPEGQTTVERKILWRHLHIVELDIQISPLIRVHGQPVGNQLAPGSPAKKRSHIETTFSANESRKKPYPSVANEVQRSSSSLDTWMSPGLTGPGRRLLANIKKSSSAWQTPEHREMKWNEHTSTNQSINQQNKQNIPLQSHCHYLDFPWHQIPWAARKYLYGRSGNSKWGFD